MKKQNKQGKMEKVLSIINYAAYYMIIPIIIGTFGGMGAFWIMMYQYPFYNIKFIHVYSYALASLFTAMFIIIYSWSKK